MSNQKLYIVKIGGNIVDDENRLSSFLREFALLDIPRILVHGGGKLATRLAEKLQIPQQLVEGRRITDSETLKIVTMVYAGFINKNIVAQLQLHNCNAIGICGADSNSILAHKRQVAGIDYGFAGDIDAVNVEFFNSALSSGQTIVVAPITHDGKGQLLNTNADTIAQQLATALSQLFSVQLIYGFEKAGVLQDANDETSVIAQIDAEKYSLLKHNGVVYAGMIPKLDNAFSAINAGVQKVIIGKAEELQNLLNGKSGTAITA